MLKDKKDNLDNRRSRSKSNGKTKRNLSKNKTIN